MAAAIVYRRRDRLAALPLELDELLPPPPLLLLLLLLPPWLLLLDVLELLELLDVLELLELLDEELEGDEELEEAGGEELDDAEGDEAGGTLGPDTVSPVVHPPSIPKPARALAPESTFRNSRRSSRSSSVRGFFGMSTSGALGLQSQYQARQ